MTPCISDNNCQPRFTLEHRLPVPGFSPSVHREPIVDDWAHTISLDAVFYIFVYAFWHIYHNLSMISECFIAYCQQYPKKH